MEALILGLVILFGLQDPTPESDSANAAPAAPRATADVVEAAIQQYRAGEREQARTAFAKLLNDAPDDHAALLNAARFLCIEQRDDKAGEPLARRVIELQPKKRESYLPMFSVLLGRTQGGAYAELCKQALAHNPDDAQLYFHLGVAHRVAQRRLDALAAFEKSIELEPGRAAAYYQAGGLALAIRRYDRAEELFREVLRRQPDDSEAPWQLARVLKYQGRDEEAEEWFRTAQPRGGAPAAYEYGVFLFESERLEEAVQALQICVQRDPRSRMGWHYLARVHHQLGNRNKSKVAMTRFRALQKERDEQDDASIRAALFGTRPPPAPTPDPEDG